MVEFRNTLLGPMPKGSTKLTTLNVIVLLIVLLSYTWMWFMVHGINKTSRRIDETLGTYNYYGGCDGEVDQEANHQGVEPRHRSVPEDGATEVPPVAPEGFWGTDGGEHVLDQQPADEVNYGWALLCTDPVRAGTVFRIVAEPLVYTEEAVSGVSEKRQQGGHPGRAHGGHKPTRRLECQSQTSTKLQPR
jgi:hypothetical protein